MREALSWRTWWGRWVAPARPPALALLLVATFAGVGPLVRAQSPPPFTLSRQRPAVTGTVAPGGSDSYLVDYQPMIETGNKPAPWLLRMYFSPPNSSPDLVDFTWLDQTSPQASAATFGNMGKGSAPTYGGNITNVPINTDLNSIEQAVLSGGSAGTFAITVQNFSTTPATYTLRVYPLIGGVIEPGLNLDVTPVPNRPTAPTPTPAAAPPAQAVPASPPPAPIFTPFWVKTLAPDVQLYSNATSPPGVSFGGIPQFTCLLVSQPAASGRYYVMNPATRNYAWVNVSDVGGLAPTDGSCGR